MSGPAFDAVRATAIPGTAIGRPRLFLLGTGTVGTAFVARWQRLAQRGTPVPRFAALANSRCALECDGDVAGALRIASGAPRGVAVRHRADGHGRDAVVHGPVSICTGVAAARPGDIVVDATASDGVAARHADWLAHGVHVVTANKLGHGADLLRAQSIARAQRDGDAQYGDAATVGAGLPLLRSIRELVAGGDRIHAVEGVLSGSLAWLFDRFDGMRPFSGFAREARDAGYTEPDPRIDLSGEDVRRKLLILARTAGLGLEAHEVQVDSLVPDDLAAARAEDVDARLASLDAPLRERFASARRQDARLRFIGRFAVAADGHCHASVGLRALQVPHALCAGSGTDNRVAIWSDRYPDQPLLIQGPGAGANVTAAALADDVLRIAKECA